MKILPLQDVAGTGGQVDRSIAVEEKGGAGHGVGWGHEWS
jgi:hypothetical protein